jgi:hypothetical protein
MCPARGVYDAPVEVEIRPATSGASIYYTLDGTAPTAETGIPYAAPITVAGAPGAGAVMLRAIAVDGAATSRVATHTYVFPAAVLAQPAAPDGFPARWGGDITTAADYAMDARVVDDPASGDLAAALRALPTVSIVLDRADLFDPARGIYANPSLEGADWERPASLELIEPHAAVAPAVAMQIDCGLRIQGGSSTQGWKAPKLSFRVAFRGAYGASRLRYPVFADSTVASFDTLILDAHLNLTWIHSDATQRELAQYARDPFVADLQNAAGSLAPHSRFVHLYLDGLYWGVYDLHERPDESFAADYLGGDEEEYDILKHSEANVIAGDGAAFAEMMALARAGLGDADRYAAIQAYLDVDDLIDYLLVQFYVGNLEWGNRNWYAARRRVDGAGFRFFTWDAEHVLKEVSQDVISNNSGPGELFQQLRASADFRARFTARVAMQFGPGGPFETADTAAARYRARADEIGSSIPLESARWGDHRRPELPYGLTDWRAERDRLLDDYFPARRAIVLDQLAARGL